MISGPLMFSSRLKLQSVKLMRSNPKIMMELPEAESVTGSPLGCRAAAVLTKQAVSPMDPS